MARLNRPNPGCVSDLKLCPDRADVLGSQRGFEPINFPLFHGVWGGSCGFCKGSLCLLVSSVLQRASARGGEQGVRQNNQSIGARPVA
jgi:hypothetical protein